MSVRSRKVQEKIIDLILQALETEPEVETNKPELGGSPHKSSIEGAPCYPRLFNNTAVYKGQWVAVNDKSHPTGKGWQLYNIVIDPAQTKNLADQHPDVLQQMISDYQSYAEDVGVLIPTGQKAAIQYSNIYPPLNQTQIIELDQIVPPFQRPNATNLKNALQFSF
jgi:hypothetical protein